MLEPEDVEVVIYHYPCSDGTGAALVPWMYFGYGAGPGRPSRKEIEFLPARIGDSPPSGLGGKNVLICDYSYDAAKTAELLKTVGKLLIIDHHKTAQRALENVGDEHKIFDMEKSGALLTWEYFYPSRPAPLLIRYIHDRDTWKNSMPGVEEFAAWFHTLPHDFATYHAYVDDDVLRSEVGLSGKHYLEHNRYFAKEAVKRACVRFTQIDRKFYVVATVNTSVLKSEIGHELLEKYPLADFSVAYSLCDYNRSSTFSLRSTDKHADVSKIASRFGGGGHRNASAFNVPYTTDCVGTVVKSGLYEELKDISFGTYGSGWSVVYLEYPEMRKRIGAYLLQDKYEIAEQNGAGGKGVQVAQDIASKMEKPFPDRVHISAVYSYSVKENKTTFVLNAVSRDIAEIIGKEIVRDGVCREI